MPLKFEFKTAMGTVRVRESIIVRIEDHQGYVGVEGMCRFHNLFIRQKLLIPETISGHYILEFDASNH